ncbi:MAG TPA: toll/interleukin-1 receptor domain-containing protein [Kofleriaceae bacterium]|nr:toll/interleukin-1 receptor domain-containing protein [Kofleriaceae bacterium]
MAYEYDIFLSYKRHPEARQWLVEHFQPLLEFHVELELGHRVTVFRDDQDDEAGASWPAHLGRALGNSRTLVALWTRTYFHSEWCSRELSTMLARERDERFRTAERPGGLIFPVVLHDCEQLPRKLVPLHYVAMQECFQTRMARNSQTAEILAQQIKDRLAPSVASAVKAAPRWRPSWPLKSATQLLNAILRRRPPRQSQVPRHSR